MDGDFNSENLLLEGQAENEIDISQYMLQLGNGDVADRASRNAPSGSDRARLPSSLGRGSGGASSQNQIPMSPVSSQFVQQFVDPEQPAPESRRGRWNPSASRSGREVSAIPADPVSGEVPAFPASPVYLDLALPVAQLSPYSDDIGSAQNLSNPDLFLPEAPEAQQQNQLSPYGDDSGNVQNLFRYPSSSNPDLFLPEAPEAQQQNQLSPYGDDSGNVQNRFRYPPSAIDVGPGGDDDGGGGVFARDPGAAPQDCFFVENKLTIDHFGKRNIKNRAARIAAIRQEFIGGELVANPTVPQPTPPGEHLCDTLCDANPMAGREVANYRVLHKHIVNNNPPVGDESIRQRAERKRMPVLSHNHWYRLPTEYMNVNGAFTNGNPVFLALYAVHEHMQEQFEDVAPELDVVVIHTYPDPRASRNRNADQKLSGTFYRAVFKDVGQVLRCRLRSPRDIVMIRAPVPTPMSVGDNRSSRSFVLRLGIAIGARVFDNQWVFIRRREQKRNKPRAVARRVIDRVGTAMQRAGPDPDDNEDNYDEIETLRQQLNEVALLDAVCQQDG